MFRNYKTIALAILLVATGACGSDSSKSPQPSSPAAAPDAKKVDAATAATITGKVLFEGTPPPNASINTDSDPACSEGGKPNLTSESIVVDNAGLQNVFVYIKDGL